MSVEELLARSHRLAADRSHTNFGGGNTSAKGSALDPVTGQPTELMWVKGSGGDLATLTEDRLAALRLDRLRSLVDVYPGVEREDEMVPLFDHCRFGAGGAAPSIDTAMHALVASSHVDHLHPEAGLAFATAADGPALTKECFGDRVVWVPWRRPGFQLGLEIAAIQAGRPEAIGVILGGHGITAWGATSRECEERSLEIIRMAREFIAAHGRPEPFGAMATPALSGAERRARAVELLPVLRGRIGGIVDFSESDVVLDFVGRERLRELAWLGTSCPDHFLRTKVRPLVLSPDSPDSSVDEQLSRYQIEYKEYYERHAVAGTPPMRGANPAIVLVPGVGMFSFGRDKQEAKVAGEFYVNAINAMRGAEAISSYAPIPEEEKFRIEYWDLEEAKLRRLPKPAPLTGKVALVTGGGSGIGLATAQRLAAEGACVVSADLKTRDDDGGREDGWRAGSAPKAATDVAADVTDEDSVRAAVESAVLEFGGIDVVVNCAGMSLSKPLLETSTSDWDRQHSVMARGSFLVSREAARILVAQGTGGDIVYIVSKNSLFAGPNNVAYGAAKADQAHQVRLLAAELGAHGIRVNGINPDGVVRGSGIFAAGWGADRAALYGVPEDELGTFYAQRTLLKREVLPEHVAAAVAVLVCGDLALTTGMHIPVDGGVAAAFLR
ncbi:MAG TPA: bifunctional rhamnulose-1-phosphate aldolase/short-chain dehydrogenase [Candidatus Limnocylindrales bacterium]